ncbi:hypothetical protein [Gluconobacter oxydans]|uniref:hypothetical protein n=1 Tax=Gluconobacter oxydans TaxID=442 RepID=UPI0039E9EB78
MTERKINLPHTRRNRAPIADGAMPFGELAVGAHFRFAASPKGSVHRKVDRGQYRIAGLPELFRLGRNTLVVPATDRDVASGESYTHLRRSSRTGRRAAQREQD